MVSSNYKLFKSNITISFLPDELIIACSLAHIDHSICRILISVDLLDEGKPHDHGRRKMIQNDSQQHRKTSKPRNNSYKKTPNVYKNLFHNPQCSHYLLKNFCKRKNNYNHFLFTFFRHEDSVKSVHIYSIEIDLIIKWRKTINTIFKNKICLR